MCILGLQLCVKSDNLKKSVNQHSIHCSFTTGSTRDYKQKSIILRTVCKSLLTLWNLISDL